MNFPRIMDTWNDPDYWRALREQEFNAHEGYHDSNWIWDAIHNPKRKRRYDPEEAKRERMWYTIQDKEYHGHALTAEERKFHLELLQSNLDKVSRRPDSEPEKGNTHELAWKFVAIAEGFVLAATLFALYWVVGTTLFILCQAIRV